MNDVTFHEVKLFHVGLCPLFVSPVCLPPGTRALLRMIKHRFYSDLVYTEPGPELSHSTRGY